MTDAVLVEADNRKRVALAKLAIPEGAQYLAHTEPDGTIVLQPAVVMTELEAKLARVLPSRAEGAEPAPDWLLEDLDRIAAEDTDAPPPR